MTSVDDIKARLSGYVTVDFGCLARDHADIREALRTAVEALDDLIMNDDCCCDQCQRSRDALTSIRETLGIRAFKEDRGL